MAASDTPFSPPDPPVLSWPSPPGAALDGLAAVLPQALVLVDAAGAVTWANPAFTALTGYTAWDTAGRALTGLLRVGTADDTASLDVGEAVAAGRATAMTVVIHCKDGQARWVDLSLTPRPDSHDLGAIAVLVDVTDRVQFGERLSLAERMAAVGTLAAGVAHEIATPVQFVGDNVQFLRDAVSDLGRVLEALRCVRAAVVDGLPASDALAAASKSVTVEDEADLEYLLEHIPNAFDSCGDGLERISTILQSLKEYAHPQQGVMARVNLNAVVERTLTLARNEYKYVADMDTSFAALPEVECVGGSIGQVVLNLVVNAAHAVGERVERTGGRGTITVSTGLDGDHVRISIRDTGAGIPDHIRPRIFEPFFTTKSVGKGTGQGLALAQRIIVEKHGGTIEVESSVGVGTVFHVRIPLASRRTAPARPEAA